MSHDRPRHRRSLANGLLLALPALAGLLLLTSAPSASVPAAAAEARAEADSDSGREPFPATLSATGYLADVKGLAMAPGFVSYRVVAEPWSDGARKQRFLRLPPGKKARFRREGPLALPDGTVIVQHVILPFGGGTRRVETRVIVVEAEEPAFATYVWREDQTDADLVPRGRRLALETESAYQLWEVTPASRCSECHVAAGGTLLGLTSEQLGVDIDGQSQLARFAEQGWLADLPEDHAALPRLVDPRDESRTLEERARSYLHVNCASCHRPGGEGSGTMDLRHGVPRDAAGLGEHREIMLDGDPYRSWIYLRMVYTDRRQMPSLLTTLVDREGADLIRDWVLATKPEAASGR